MRRYITHDRSGTSAQAVLKPTEVLYDIRGQVVRIGDGNLVGGRAIDPRTPVDQATFDALVHALMQRRYRYNGRRIGIPRDPHGESATFVLLDCEIVMDGAVLRLGDGVTPGGVPISVAAVSSEGLEP